MSHLDGFGLESQAVEGVDGFLGVLRVHVINKSVAQTLACERRERLGFNPAPIQQIRPLKKTKRSVLINTHTHTSGTQIRTRSRAEQTAAANKAEGRAQLSSTPPTGSGGSDAGTRPRAGRRQSGVDGSPPKPEHDS